MGLAKALPLPEFLAYDAFNEDIPAHILYELIQDIGEEDNRSTYYAFVKEFLRVVYTSQKVSASKVKLLEQLFKLDTLRKQSSIGMRR